MIDLQGAKDGERAAESAFWRHRWRHEPAWQPRGAIRPAAPPALYRGHDGLPLPGRLLSQVDILLTPNTGINFVPEEYRPRPEGGGVEGKSV